MSDIEFQKIPVGISTCLLGERVRFDGGHKKNDYIMKTLGEFFEYHSHCPEVSIGMGVPRETIRLIDISESTSFQAVGVKNPSLDVTEQLIDDAKQQHHWHRKLRGYIVKKDSPSCGMERVKVYKKNHPEKRGAGLYTLEMMNNFPDLPVEEEGRLGDALLRENFVHRVFIYDRWFKLLEEGLTWSGLTGFHANHKYILYSHNQDKARELGRLLAESHDEDIKKVADKYLSKMMSLLKVVATRRNHVNVLQHIRGYLKNDLDTDDKKELTESIENYRQGLLPLIVPITLLRHHLRKYPKDYIERSYYLEPHPGQLMLLNSL